jgi:serine/threonine-protein kinase
MTDELFAVSAAAVLASAGEPRYSEGVVANSDLPVPEGVVAGKYRLTRLLGRGGMGAVWEGTHISLATRVAVKFIDAEYAASPEARSRFENEARAAARLRSKHVVEVYDHGVSDDARPFIVMEFLQGEPLDKRLDRVGRLPAKETARIVMQVCRALTKAHAANIVHRDLKPENVFLVWDEEEGTDVVKVVDFGIAKFNDSSQSSSSATRTGSVLGTPHYMSPEQARGLRSVDSRSDLWSVAVIAYRCIVGALPFEGEAVGDLLVKLCTAPLPVPSLLVPDVPPGFDAWLEKGLSRDPALRFATAAQLAESLAAVCGLSVRVQGLSSESLLGPDGQSGAYPAIVGTPRPTVGQALGLPAVSSLQATALSTGAPTTQTPVPGKRTGTGVRLAVALAGLVVLGTAGALGAKALAAPPVLAAAAPPKAAPPVSLAAKSGPPAAEPATPRSEPIAEVAAAPVANAAAPGVGKQKPLWKPLVRPPVKANPQSRQSNKPATPNMGF